MIKINIENPSQLEKEYVSAIIEPLAKRVRCVKKVIDYLKGSHSDINNGEISFMKTATIAVIKKIDAHKEIALGRRYAVSDFNAANYSTSIRKYINNPNSLDNNQLTRVSNFFSYLLNNNNKLLKVLLDCKPNNLSTHYKLLKTYINHSQDLFYLKLAFNYEKNVEITKLVKGFYRDKNFIKYCPYCNLDKVEYSENAKGQAAARHDLDHFYDKATFPLLCFSMYNLVPSDTTCNQTNKISIEFTDTYHLNPYSDGFNNSLVFRAVLNDNSEYKYKVKLKSNEDDDNDRYRKIYGKYDDPGNLNFGNVNAFKLDIRYKKEEEHLSLMALKMDTYDKFAWKAIYKYVVLLKKNRLEDSYKKLYLDQFHTPFDKKLFGEYKYAKLNRDIHDQYFNKMFGNQLSIKKKLENFF
jgi:hypothetical protein